MKASTPSHQSFTELIPSFRRSLQARNRSPNTIANYLGALARFTDYLQANNLPLSVGAVERKHLEGFIAETLAVRTPSTAATRYRWLRGFFNWCVEEGELDKSPMIRMKVPNVPDAPPAVLDEAALRKLLRVCEGKSFRQRRDTAIIRLLLDTGMRRGELAGMKVSDIDWDNNVAFVVGKGRRPRACPFGRKSAQSLDRYLRVRQGHTYALSEALWLGEGRGHGAMTGNGIYQTVRARARQAGVEGVFVHLFRHSAAHHWLAAGGQETDLMMLMGWRSRTVMSRYGASAAAARAKDAHVKLSLGDKV